MNWGSFSDVSASLCASSSACSTATGQGPGAPGAIGGGAGGGQGTRDRRRGDARVPPDYASSSSWSNASTEQVAFLFCSVPFFILANRALMRKRLFTSKSLAAESKSLLGNPHLSDECDEWSHFFPHLRICGHSSLSQVDTGYEHISRAQVRSCSPYFLVPERTHFNNSATKSMRLHGIFLPANTVARKEKELDEKDRIDAELNPPSIFKWDTNGLDCLRRQKVEWCIFQYNHREYQNFILQNPIPSNYDEMIQLKAIVTGKRKKNVPILDELKGAMSSINLADVDAAICLAVIDEVEVIKEVLCNSNGILKNNIKDSQQKKSVLFIHCHANSSFSQGPSAFDVALALNVSSMRLLCSLRHNEKADWSVYELSAGSVENFLNSTSIQEMDVDVLKMTPTMLSTEYEDVFACNGVVEEYFAHDNMEMCDETSHIMPSYSRIHRRRGLPPITPNASIRQDIVSHMLDEIWSEIVPILEPLHRKLQAKDSLFSAEVGHSKNEPFKKQRGTHQSIHPAVQQHASNDSDEEDLEFSPSLLVSAMTIKSLSLQQRQSSARIKNPVEVASGSDFTSAGISFGGFSSRPASARPTSSGRALASGRPTSGRTQDSVQQLQTPSRVGGTSAPKTAATRSAMKRTGTAMRLTPLLATAMPPTGMGSSGIAIGMNDVLVGTSMSIGGNVMQIGGARPSTSNGYGERGNSALKKLPPIKLALNPVPDAESYSSMNSKTVNRHVIFDTSEAIETLRSARSNSPRPFSAKRPPSGTFRRPHTAVSRPQTTMDELRHHHINLSTSAGNKNSKNSRLPNEDSQALSPVQGMRIARLAATTSAKSSAAGPRLSTGLTGVAVHPNPRPELLALYSRIQHTLPRLPESSVYRQSVAAIVSARAAIVETTESVEEIEQKIGAGCIEELIKQAEVEASLVVKMAEWEPWRPLETPAPEGQWTSATI
ncbi:hypothetical protein HDU83_004947 [Entophlyctis luteolus]|nr:hypothetical protein HDU83_004947 [Entophlyctis luteolus]